MFLLFLVALWYLILILGIKCTIQFGISKRFGDMFIGIIFIILYLVVSFFVADFLCKLDDKKIAKRKREYREKYISDIELEDEKYGKMIFEKDSNTETMELKDVNLPSFGNHIIKNFVINDCDCCNENMKNLIFRNLDEVYNNSEKILEDLHNEIKDIYDDEDIRDSDGNLMSMDYIKEKLILDYINVYLSEDSCIIELLGSMDNDIDDHIAEHGITASIDIQNNKYDYFSG
ncbi:MAG: hypothetical protein K2G63_01960 [Oscillospiraceae bacterium]|nr:hypothetical protein [Oscillospiraceae bacterium]